MQDCMLMAFFLDDIPACSSNAFATEVELDLVIVLIRALTSELVEGQVAEWVQQIGDPIAESADSPYPVLWQEVPSQSCHRDKCGQGRKQRPGQTLAFRQARIHGLLGLNQVNQWTDGFFLALVYTEYELTTATFGQR